MADSAKPLAGKRCLVLDDEWLIALDIQAILEAAGAAVVVCAGTVEEALGALQQQAVFDIAVLDMLLGQPVGNSLAVANALLKQRVPFIFLTGMRSGDLAHAAQFPAAPVVEKPYQAKLLLEAIARALTAK